MFSPRLCMGAVACTIAAWAHTASAAPTKEVGSFGTFFVATEDAEEPGAHAGFVYETGQDLWGNDIPPMLTAASADECALKCAGIASCTAFTFHVSSSISPMCVCARA